MKREMFEEILNLNRAEGWIFLLNLADSMEIELLQPEALKEYGDRLKSPLSSDQYPWLEPITEIQGARRPPEIGDNRSFVSVVTVGRRDVEGAVGFKELVDEPPDPGDLATATVAQTIFMRTLTRKHTWVTDALALADRTSANDIRDALGLDWVHEDVNLFAMGLPTERIMASVPMRPTGLCKGSARFRARRDDEGSHRQYQFWGYTVDLRKWRDAAPDAKVQDLAGAPELVCGIGPVDATFASLVYLGETDEPSGCNDEDDHLRFARQLNGGEALDPDRLYKRLHTAPNES